MNAGLKVKKTSAADQVCERIRELVLRREWPVDKKIPAEAQLAALFGVNRLTVRVALQRLNALGILETRDGDGTYVRAFDFTRHLQTISDFYVDHDVMSCVGEYRLIIETQCARLAVERVKEEDLHRLSELCTAFAREVSAYDALQTDAEREQAYLRTIEETLAIHTEFCRLSKNPLLAMAFEIAQEPIRRYMKEIAKNRFEDRTPDRQNIWVKAHWALYEGLRDHDAQKCCQELRHIIIGQ